MLKISDQALRTLHEHDRDAILHVVGLNRFTAFTPRSLPVARITYVTPDGEVVIVEAAQGSLMTAAVQNQVKGIDGECGGVCSCGTCHVHVDPEWLERVGPPNDTEVEMLELDDHMTPASRLGCQVPIRPELDGLKVRVVGR
jgi:2Fe-2S ferredoxin